MIKTLFFCLLIFSFSAQSQVSESQEDELQKVQDLLRFHEKNKEAAEKSDPNDEFHGMAASILEGIKASPEGQRNPTYFQDKFTPEQEKQLRELSEKLKPGAKINAEE